MNRTPCIAFRPNSPNIVTRRDFLDICEGKHPVALVLSQMMYWHEVKVAPRSQALTTNRQSTAVGKAATQNTDVWVWKKQAELQSELLKSHGIRAIGEALVYLVERGFLSERNNPYNQYDRTMQYRFETEAVQAAIDALPSLSQESEIIDDGDAPPVAPRLRSNKTAKTQAHSRPFVEVVNETAFPQSRKITSNRGDETAETQLCERNSAASTLQDCGLLSKTTSEITYSKTTTTDHTPASVSGGGAVSGRGDVCSVDVDKNTNADAPDAVCLEELKELPLTTTDLSPQPIMPAAIKSDEAPVLSVPKNDLRGENETRIKIPNQVKVRGTRTCVSAPLSVTENSNAKSVIKSDDLLGRLVSIGVKRNVGIELVDDYDRADIERQIAYLPYRKATNLPATLVASIKGENGGWSAPPAYIAAQAAAEKEREDARVAADYEANQKRRGAEKTAYEADKAAKLQRVAEVATVVARLSESQQDALEAAVWEELAKEPYPVGPVARAVIDKVKSADDAKRGNVVGRAYKRVEAHMIAEIAAKGGLK